MTADDARPGTPPKPDDVPRDLTGILDALMTKTEEDATVSVGRIMEAFSKRLFGPLLVIPGLVMISPLGGIPFLPAVLAILVLLVAGQRMASRGRPWVPQWLTRQSVERDKLVTAASWLKSLTRWVDRLIKPRLEVFVGGWMETAIAAAACIMGVLIFPLAPIPFAVQLPAWGLVMLGLATIAQDGLLALVGLLLAGASLGLGLWMFVF